MRWPSVAALRAGRLPVVGGLLSLLLAAAGIDAVSVANNHAADTGGEGGAMSRAMLLGELLPELEGLSADLAIAGLVQDSREIRPGDAFVAIAGFGAHGLNFVDAAREAGAAAILFEPPAPAELPPPADAIPVTGLRARMGAMADTFHGHPSAAMTTVGVTGTNGKT